MDTIILYIDGFYSFLEVVQSEIIFFWENLDLLTSAVEINTIIYNNNLFVISYNINNFINKFNPCTISLFFINFFYNRSFFNVVIDVNFYIFLVFHVLNLWYLPLNINLVLYHTDPLFLSAAVDLLFYKLNILSIPFDINFVIHDIFNIIKFLYDAYVMDASVAINTFIFKFSFYATLNNIFLFIYDVLLFVISGYEDMAWIIGRGVLLIIDDLNIYERIRLYKIHTQNELFELSQYVRITLAELFTDLYESPIHIVSCLYLYIKNAICSFIYLIYSTISLFFAKIIGAFVSLYTSTGLFFYNIYMFIINFIIDSFYDLVEYFCTAWLNIKITADALLDLLEFISDSIDTVYDIIIDYILYIIYFLINIIYSIKFIVISWCQSLCDIVFAENNFLFFFLLFIITNIVSFLFLSYLGIYGAFFLNAISITIFWVFAFREWLLFLHDSARIILWNGGTWTLINFQHKVEFLLLFDFLS